MNKQELIERLERLIGYGSRDYIERNEVLGLAKQLDEPETGHADEAPRYLKNILARLRELPLHNREVWLKVIMSEFKQDFSRAKWREGYEQGRIEGMVEREKVKVPQFVADYIEESRLKGWDLLASMCFVVSAKNKKTTKWFYLGENKNIFALAWIFGYEVEKEKRYLVKMKGMSKENTYLTFRFGHTWMLSNFEDSEEFRLHHTRKELEEAGFGWVFDCPGVEIEEVE